MLFPLHEMLFPPLGGSLPPDPSHRFFREAFLTPTPGDTPLPLHTNMLLSLWSPPFLNVVV